MRRASAICAGALVREARRLLLLRELQRVLGASQPGVRRRERGRRRLRQVLELRQRRQRLEHVAGAQREVAAAKEQLERLHQELDVADPAGALLQVELEIAPGAAPLVLDARLHVAHRAHHVRIDQPAVDEGRDLAREGFADVRAGRRPGAAGSASGAPTPRRSPRSSRAPRRPDSRARRCRPRGADPGRRGSRSRPRSRSSSADLQAPDQARDRVVVLERIGRRRRRRRRRADRRRRRS